MVLRILHLRKFPVVAAMHNVQEFKDITERRYIPVSVCRKRNASKFSFDLLFICVCRRCVFNVCHSLICLLSVVVVLSFLSSLGSVHHNKFHQRTIVPLNRRVWVCHKQIYQHVVHRHTSIHGPVHCALMWIHRRHHVAPNVRPNVMLCPNHRHTPPIRCKNKSMHWAYERLSIQRWMWPPSIEPVRWVRIVCLDREQI